MSDWEDKACGGAAIGGAIIGAIIGLIVGFQGAGIGGAIVGIAIGAAGGCFIGLMIFVAIPWMILIAILGGIVFLISILWGVGKP